MPLAGLLAALMFFAGVGMAKILDESNPPDLLGGSALDSEHPSDDPTDPVKQGIGRESVAEKACACALGACAPISDLSGQCRCSTRTIICSTISLRKHRFVG